MSYCIYCGTKNRDEALFCRNCGKPLSEPESKENIVEEPVVQKPIIEEKPAVPEPIVEEQPAAPEPIVEEKTIIQEKPIAQKEPIVRGQRETSYSSTVNVSKPRNKTLITLFILIPVILLLAAIVGGAIFLFSASNTIKEEMESTMESITQEAEESQDIEESPEDTKTVGEAIPEENEAEDVSDATDDDVVAENTTEAAVPSATALSTKAKPKAADFKEWFVNGAMKAGKPNGVKTLSSLSDISGSWKAFLFLDPTNRNGEKAQTFGTVTFDGTNERIKVYLKRYYTHFFNDNENMDESSEAPDFFSARWKAGQLIASGVGSFVITDFWEQDGKQYAIGTFSTQDGITASMGLVRP